MSQEPKNKEEGFMYKFASFIVDKRNLIFLIVAIGLVFSVFSRSWVQVENQLSAYLPKESETYKGLHLITIPTPPPSTTSPSTIPRTTTAARPS